MGALRGRIIAGGRVAIPAELRRKLALDEGEAVFFEVDGDALRIRSAKSALKAIQDRLRDHASDGVSVTDELIADRRAEDADG